MRETSTSLIAARLLLLNTFKQHLNNRRGHNYINKGGDMKQQLTHMVNLNAHLDDWAIE